MGGRKSVAWALLLVVALAGGCGREVSFKAAEKGGGVRIDWSSVTPAEVEELIAKGELDVKGFYQGKGDKEILFSTPMMIVLNSGNIEVLDVLMEHGADIDYYLTGVSKLTALDLAVYSGNIEIARWLLELGAAIEKKDGKPTIHSLFDSGRLKPDRRKEMLDLLLEYGADINALDYREKEYYVVLTPLMRFMGNKIFYGSPEDYTGTGIISYMVARGADINMRPLGSAVTAMSFAVMGTDANVVEELISLGGDVNLQSDAGCWTPLLFYVFWGQSIEVFDVLTDNGANLDGRTCLVDGYGILDILAARRSGGELSHLEGNPIFGYIKFATEEERHDFGDKIVERISALCGEFIYEICHDLEERT